MQNRVPYIANNTDLKITAVTQNNDIAYIDFSKNNELIGQIIFNYANGFFGVSEKTTGSWKAINFNKAGIQKLAFIFNDFNGDILDISIAPGIYAVKSENPGNPSNNYALLIVIKYDNNNWIFNFLIPTDLTKLYINFYNAYGDAGWSGWKHVDIIS